MQKDKETSLETLQDIRAIMERSARFLSLSGWSGIWAGGVAVIAAIIAYNMLHNGLWGGLFPGVVYGNYIFLGICTLVVALIGAWMFTAQKAKKQGLKVWNKASRQLAWQIAIPMLTGGLFIFAFIYHGVELMVSPACLCFYGLALINGSKYTLPDIRYLGYLEVVLGCINLYCLGYGIYFLAFGFGILHIVYGIIMWNKYDRNIA